MEKSFLISQIGQTPVFNKMLHSKNINFINKISKISIRCIIHSIYPYLLIYFKLIYFLMQLHKSLVWIYIYIYIYIYMPFILVIENYDG